MKRINKGTKAITQTNLESKISSKCKTCNDNDVNYSIGFFEAMTMVK